MTRTFDVIVLGLGPGGEEVAGSLAEAGLEVAGIEANLVGGECPYWGCVPTKMMIRAANALAEARRVGDVAGSASVTPDWAPVAKRIRKEATDHWDDRVAVERLQRKGGTFIRGRGRLTGARTAEVDGEAIEARRAVVVATGARPVIPPIPGLDAVSYWTNHEAVAVEALPRSLAVLGGGAIGAELAQVFARFGVDVTVIEAAERLLVQEEPEAGEIVRGAFERDGITVRANAKASRVSAADGQIVVAIDEGSGSGEVRAERLLVATGRRPDLRTLGVESIGVDPGGAGLEVDERMRVQDGVYALGDVTNIAPFTHMAMSHAGVVVRDILGREGPLAERHAIPRVTFTDPEVGAVGMTEASAREKGLEVRVGVAKVPSSARGWIHKVGNDGVIKLVADGREDVLVGALSVGPAGGEVLSMLTLAVHARIPLDRLTSMIYAYPTFHRGVEDALRDLRS